MKIINAKLIKHAVIETDQGYYRVYAAGPGHRDIELWNAENRAWGTVYNTEPAVRKALERAANALFK